MPLDRPYHHGHLRQAILAAAIDALTESGPARLSLRELARRAGVSHAAPAHHFGDKAGLLTAVAAQGYTLLADALTAALRTHRDRAMVAAMLLGGLRRCEVLRLRLEDLHVGARRVFIAEGKGGHQRQVPISRRFFTQLGDYLTLERPAEADQFGHGHVFCVLKGPRRGHPLSASGLDEVLEGDDLQAGSGARLGAPTVKVVRVVATSESRLMGMSLPRATASTNAATWLR